MTRAANRRPLCTLTLPLSILALLLVAINVAEAFEFQILEAAAANTQPQLNPIFFGVGVAMEPLTKDILAVGIDANTQRQFAVLYTQDQTKGAGGGYLRQQRPVFLADPVGTTLLTPNVNSDDPGIVAPLCLSANSQWIALGMRPNGYNSTGSVLIARRVADSASGDVAQFVLHSRLFSDMLPTGISYFPGDMVCTRDMERIFVSEVSTTVLPTTLAANATGLTARLTLFNKVTPFNSLWIVNRTEDYTNGTHTSVPALALTSNGALYAFRSAEGNFVYVRYANGTLVDAVDVSILNLTPRQMAISSTGRWLLVSDPACLNFAGCAFAIQFNATTKKYSVSSAISLLSPLITTTRCQLGYSLALASNQTTRLFPSVVIGAPGCPELLVGSSFEWVSRASTVVPNGTEWTTPNVTLNPFGPGVVPGIRLGAMSWSHNFMSDDQVSVAIGAPGSSSLGFWNTTNPGRVYVFKYFLPPAPPSSSPLGPPMSPGPDDVVPEVDPTIEAQLAEVRNWFIALIVIGCVMLAAAIFGICRACTIRYENNIRIARQTRGGNRSVIRNLNE